MLSSLERPDVKFSGVLINQLLLRKVKSKENNEMNFLIGGKVLRFRLLEFALIIRLNFGEYPNSIKIIEMTISRRLVETYMNNDVTSKLTDLENAFLSCEDVEDCWKLGLCYLVENLLFADEPTSKVNLDFLLFVEDEEFFFQYPWGLDLYYKIYVGINKDVIHYKNIYIYIF